MKKLFSIFMISFLIISCKKDGKVANNQFFYFEGASDKEALLSRVLTDNSGKRTLIPIKRLFTNTKTDLKPGNYLLSNECSSFNFYHNKDKPTHVNISHVQMDLLGDVPKETEIQSDTQAISSICHNVLSAQDTTSNNKVQFDILPGKNEIFIGGKNITLNFSPDKAENITVELVSLSLSSSVPGDVPFFYVVPKNDTKHIVLSAPINGKMWLFPGQYSVEINGTKQIVNIVNKIFHKFELGLLKVSAPKNFPLEKRAHLGGQPISAYINDKVLIRLNAVYPVFPGKYTLNLEGSDLEKEINVEENKLTDIKTVGAQIDAPACEENQTSCGTTTRITVHENKQPFPLMMVPVGIPFLVFEGNFQYGVEGVKGIFKNLPTSSDSVKVESLGKVKLKWEIRPSATGQSTDFVRLESKSGNLFGKSVDLSFFKPSEIYLPQGNYWLTYFVGEEASPNAAKSKVDVDLVSGNLKEVTIPFYVHGSKARDAQKDSFITPHADGASVLSPLKK